MHFLQIFEVIELKEFPFMITKEILEGGTVRDILTSENENKVFLLVDDDLKRIWPYNGSKSTFKLQIYGSVLANMLRTQLRLFYRVYPLNIYHKNDNKFEEILDKPISGGRAKPIEKDDFNQSKYGTAIRPDISIIQNVDVNKSIEYINEIPRPENFIRKFFIVGGNVYTDEEIPESFIKEEKEKITIKPLKLGRLNRGFTFFDGDYSIRLIINNQNVQGIELYTHKSIKSIPLKLNIPIFKEDKFSNVGNMDVLMKSFQVPDEVSEKIENQNLDQNQNSR